MKYIRSLLILFNVMLLCFAQPVYSRVCCGQFVQEDFDPVGLLTLSEPGTYRLSESVKGKVIISEDDVVFDLCDNKITGTNETGDDREAIEVLVDLKNITIRNGIVESEHDRGIVVRGNEDCCGPRLEHLRVQNCAKEAVLFDNVLNGRIEACEFISSSTGLVLNESEQVIVHNSVASCNKIAGFALHASSNNCFSKCKAFANGGGDLYEGVEGPNPNNVDRFGFVSTDGCGNVFQECCAEANTIPFFDPIGFCRSVAGFAFVGTETCSKIIDCKSENNWAPYQFDVFKTHKLVKSATPYGILLKSKLHVIGDNELELVTAVDPGDEAGGTGGEDHVYSVDWSPDGKYLAVGGNLPHAWYSGEPQKKDLKVYTFDLSTSPTLTLLATVDPGDEPGSGYLKDWVYSARWSPDAKYLAVGGAIQGDSGGDDRALRVYSFDPAAHIPLTLLSSVDPGDEPDGPGQFAEAVFSVDWSPNGKYLAVGGIIEEDGYFSSRKDLRVYVFDPAANNPLTLVTSVNPGGGSASDRIYAVDWSPDGKHLAVGGFIQGADNKDLRVYAFDLATSPTLTLVTAVDPAEGSENDTVWELSWSPDGCFLAIAGEIIGPDASNKNLRVYSFDLAASPTLVLVAGDDLADAATRCRLNQLYAVDWSPDGKYLAVGGDDQQSEGKNVLVYAFDLAASDTLTLLASVNPGGEKGDPIYSTRWSPDGQYLAVGGRIFDGSFQKGYTEFKDLLVYKALDFPTKNVIKRNIVACNCIRHHEQTDDCGCDLDVCPKGVGISGTSICNMIMENESYNNPFNYQFVTNVFDQRFGNMPSLLQNIALKGCEPVCIPDDCGRNAKENNVLIRRLMKLFKDYQYAYLAS